MNMLALREVERGRSLSRWTLYKMIRSGRLAAVKLPSGQFRVPEQEVDAIMQGPVQRSGNVSEN